MTTEKFEEYYKRLMEAKHPEFQVLLEEVKKIIEQKEGIKVECDRKEDHLA